MVLLLDEVDDLLLLFLLDADDMFPVEFVLFKELDETDFFKIEDLSLDTSWLDFDSLTW